MSKWALSLIQFEAHTVLKLEHIENCLCFLLFSLPSLEHSLNFLRFQPCPIRHSERESTKPKKKHQNWASHREFLLFWLWFKVQIYLLFGEIFTANFLDALAECLVAAEELWPSRRWAHIEQAKQNNENDGKYCQKCCRHLFEGDFSRVQQKPKFNTEQVRQSKEN